MKTTTPSAGPNKTGNVNAVSKEKAKEKAPAKARKNKKKKKEKEEKNNSNNNQVKHLGLIQKGILKSVTISLGTLIQMTTDYRHSIWPIVAYAASKGYKYWSGVIKNLEALNNDVWKIPRPDKKQCVTKCTIKMKYEGGNNILKQTWIVTDCEFQMELEDNYDNKL